MARTLSVWSPGSTSTRATHCTYVSALGTVASDADCQSPSSTEISTPLMPVCWCQATPATGAPPATISPPPSGTSIREAILTGPSSDQPRSVQYAEMSANFVTFISTTHLHAET